MRQITNNINSIIIRSISKHSMVSYSKDDTKSFKYTYRNLLLGKMDKKACSSRNKQPVSRSFSSFTNSRSFVFNSISTGTSDVIKFVSSLVHRVQLGYIDVISSGLMTTPTFQFKNLKISQQKRKFAAWCDKGTSLKSRQLSSTKILFVAHYLTSCQWRAHMTVIYEIGLLR